MKITRFIIALFCAAEMTAHLARGQDLLVDGGTNDITSGTNPYANTFVGLNTSSNQLNVSGSGTVLTNSLDVYVGFTGSSNSMVISNGGRVANVVGSVGYNTPSSNNSVLVTGSNSAWVSSGNLYVGHFGMSNKLEISDGGSVVAPYMAAGRWLEATHNQVIVGSNATITVSDKFDVGFGGSSNSLIITNGGKVFLGTGGSSIGSFNALSNSVLVTGPESTLSNVGVYFVGFQGAGNQLTLSNQGSLISDTLSVGGSVGGGLFGSNNTVLVTSNASITVNGGLSVGREGAFNGMTISGGGAVTSSYGYIGYATSSSNNSVLVTGSNSTWTNNDDLYIGYQGSSNSLVISNGGTVANAYARIGYIATSSNNSVLVTGANSLWTNSNDLYFGYQGSSNSLVISDGAKVAASFGAVGLTTNSSNNSVLVTGTGSTWTSTDDFCIGFPGSGNSLVISNGGGVVNVNGYIGLGSTSSNNSVLVTGANSTWTNSGELRVGNEGSGNSLVISNGGNVFAANLGVGVNSNSDNNSVAVTGSNSVLGFWEGRIGWAGSSNSLIVSNGAQVTNGWTYIGTDTNSDRNSIVVTGAGSRWDGEVDFNVGYNGSSNTLVVSDGATVTHGGHHRGAALGVDAGSSNNSALVTGSNSSWTSLAGFFVGYGGSGNSLVISNGGAVSNAFGHAGGAMIGRHTNASNNTVLVTGSNSSWSSSADFFVGYASSDNSLVITNGGLVSVTSASFVGFEQGSVGNTAVVAGTDSRWTNSGNFFVGVGGSSNSLVISNGGNVSSAESYIGLATNSSNNSVVVTGSGSLWTSAGVFDIGREGSGNRLTLSDDGDVTASNTAIGRAGGSSSNSMLVTGAGSTWTDGASFYVGAEGDGNSLVISNGGVVTSFDGQIGFWATASNNIVTVTGADSTWTSSSGFFVGSSGSGNTMTISDRGRVASDFGVIGFFADSSNNTVMVTGASSVWTNSGALSVGSSGSSNSLVISNGATVANDFGYIGLNTDASNNSVLVTGTNSNGDRSTWTNSGDLVIGQNGSGNSLVISSGAFVTSVSGFLSYSNPSSNNTVTVTDAGSVWTNSGALTIGLGYSGNSLVISNGGEVINADGFIGVNGAASNNTVTVTGAGSIWTNKGALTVGVFGTHNTLTVANGGTVAALNIVIASASGSGGTLNIGSLGGSDAGGAIDAPTILFGAGYGVINFNQGDTLTFSNVISGNGAVNQLGTGQTVLSGVNTYTGGTTVNAGTLATLGDDRLATSGTVAVNANGTFVLGGNQTLAAVTGAGAMQLGANTLTVGAGNGTFSGVISGPGAVTKIGSGIITFSGANIYSGPTTVTAGTLVAASRTALGTGAVNLTGGTLELRSVLDIASLLWDGAATIALPGAGAGQFLTVTGLLELTNGANNFNLVGATLPRSPVKLLTSTNLPSLSTNDFGVLGLGSYSLSIDGDSLYLTAQDISYQTFAITPNQVNVATALDTFIGATGDRGTVSAALDSLEISQYPAAFEQLMPSPYASLPSMVFNVANALNSSLFQRMWAVRVNGGGFSSSGLDLAPLQAEMGGTDDMGVFAINPSRDLKWSSFVDGNGVFANASSTGSVQNYRSQSGGVTTGVSYAWNNNLSTGVYAGYQGLQAEYNSGKTIDNAVRFGVFGTYDVEDFYFNALVGGAYHGYTVNRYINFGGLDRTATGRPGAGEFNLALGTGYDFQAGDLTFGPFTTLQYTYLGMQGFTETGAGSLNLDVEPYNSSSMLYTLGAQAAYNWKISDKVIVTPTAFAGWQHEFLQNGYTINSSFATGGPAAPFNYNTSSPARDNFYGGAGVTLSVGERWQASFIYSASAANENNSSQNLYLGLGYKF